MINLNTPLGQYANKGLIEDILVEEVTLPATKEKRDKICLLVKRSDGKTIRVNEVLVEDYKGSKNQRGLWVSLDEKQSVHYFSTLGKFMRRYKVNTINDLKGLQIDLFVGNKDLLVGSTEAEKLEKSDNQESECKPRSET